MVFIIGVGATINGSPERWLRGGVFCNLLVVLNQLCSFALRYMLRVKGHGGRHGNVIVLEVNISVSH